MTFELQFPEEDLSEWAQRYDYTSGVYESAVAEAGKKMKEQGHLTLNQLARICEWKTSRSKPTVQKNTDAFVREVTSACSTSETERFRISVLTLLQGVGWPTASVVLHFGHEDRYPIIDIRALESLGREKPSTYTFDLWWGYVQACRGLADRNGLTMREVDQALWKHSTEVKG
jgi:hypothetical protein